MKLKKGIVYRTYGEHTVLFDCNGKRKMIFEGVAGDVLSIITNDVPLSFILAQIFDIYEIQSEDRNSVQQDITSFLRSLNNLGLLESSDSALDNDTTYADTEKLLQDLCDEMHQLEHVYFELTYRCNMRCSHCYEGHDDEVSELSFPEICSILDELKSLQVLELTFTGGEPAVRKDFLQICAYASLLGFGIHIYSNGNCFSDDQIIELSKMNIVDVSFSVYSLDESIHDAITNQPGSLRKTLKALFAFRSNGINVVIKTVVMKQNMKSFEGIVDFTKLMRIPLETSLQVLPPHNEKNMAEELRLSNSAEYYSCMMYEATKLGYGTSENIYCSGEREQICGLGKTLNICPDGTVYPCNVLMVPIGNVKDNSINDIWNSKVLRELRGLGINSIEDECKGCDAFNYCLYCPGANKREMGSMWKHSSEMCVLAKTKKRVFETLRQIHSSEGGESNEAV